MSELKTAVNHDNRPSRVTGSGRRIVLRVAGVCILVASTYADQVKPADATAGSHSAAASIDLNIGDYYPNSQPGYYDEGINNASPGQPTASDFWFETSADGKSIVQHNTAPDHPDAECSSDFLQQTDAGVMYNKTAFTCDGSDTEMKYMPAINIMPKFALTYDGQKWVTHGESYAVFWRDGEIACEGLTRWMAEVESVSSKGITTKDTQETNWTKGNDSSGCGVGKTSGYEEAYNLVDNMPKKGTNETVKSIGQIIGGSTARFAATGGHPDFSVTFTDLAPLPVSQ